MKKYIQNYVKEIENKLKKDISKNDLNELKDKINFFSHERIVHMFIMLFCILILLIFIILSLTNEMFILPTIILIVLNIFYILHYYFLENSVQYLYKLYDKMNDKIK
jgi:lipopolysaccharide export LptBFGC system permease protein LptF